MEILLKANQLQLINGTESRKKELQDEFQKITEYQNSIIVAILEALDIPLVDGIKVEDGKIIVPEPKMVDPTIQEPKKLKKVK